VFTLALASDDRVGTVTTAAGVTGATWCR